MRHVVVAVLTLLADRAYAQECHHPARSTSPLAVRVGVAAEAGAIDDDLGRSGHYRGVVTTMELAALGGRARVGLGAYQVRWGQTGEGLGDLQLGLERGVVTRGAVTLGLAISATLPTGDVRHGLGMGHPMVMPSAWAQWRRDRSSLVASVLYGSMLGNEHAHGMIGPLQSPMNPQEMAGSLRAGHALGRTELSATVSGATPIGDGSSRAAMGAGTRWAFGATEVAVDVAVVVGGSPLQTRGVVEISRGF